MKISLFRLSLATAAIVALSFASHTAEASQYTFVTESDWAENFVVKNPSAALEVQGGGLSFTAQRFGSSIAFLGTQDGLRPLSSAETVEADFRVEGTGSLGLFIRGRPDASDAYLILAKRTPRGGSDGFGEIQIFRCPIWPAANLGELVPRKTFSIRNFDSRKAYRLKIKCEDKDGRTSLSVSLIEMKVVDNALAEGTSVGGGRFSDDSGLGGAGTFAMRLYVQGGDAPALLRLFRLSITPDPEL